MRHCVNDLRHPTVAIKTKIRPHVALLVESSRSYGRALLRGIALYARNHTEPQRAIQCRVQTRDRSDAGRVSDRESFVVRKS